jgi:hypothetical protein
MIETAKVTETLMAASDVEVYSRRCYHYSYDKKRGDIPFNVVRT